jgi:hypothetical protein
MTPFSELSYEELLAEGYIVVSSPGSVTARLGELRGKPGSGQLIGLFALGGLPHEQGVSSMELFAPDVMPALRPLGATA